MSELRSTDGRRVYDAATGEWRDRSAVARWADSARGSNGWLIAGVAVLALGAWAWYHFGGDVKRYLKMERM